MIFKCEVRKRTDLQAHGLRATPLAFFVAACSPRPSLVDKYVDGDGVRFCNLLAAELGKHSSRLDACLWTCLFIGMVLVAIGTSIGPGNSPDPNGSPGSGAGSQNSNRMARAVALLNRHRALLLATLGSFFLATAYTSAQRSQSAALAADSSLQAAGAYVEGTAPHGTKDRLALKQCLATYGAWQKARSEANTLALAMVQRTAQDTADAKVQEQLFKELQKDARRVANVADGATTKADEAKQEAKAVEEQAKTFDSSRVDQKTVLLALHQVRGIADKAAEAAREAQRAAEEAKQVVATVRQLEGTVDTDAADEVAKAAKQADQALVEAQDAQAKTAAATEQLTQPAPVLANVERAIQEAADKTEASTTKAKQAAEATKQVVKNLQNQIVTEEMPATE